MSTATPAAARLPLVLCPGLLCDAALWAPQVAALADVADIWIPDLTRQSTLAEMGATVLREAPWPRFALAGSPARIGCGGLCDSRGADVLLGVAEYRRSS